jgi:hypothetical protein
MRRILTLVVLTWLSVICLTAVQAQTTCPPTIEIEECLAMEAGCGSSDTQLNLRKNYTSDPKSRTPELISLEEIKRMEYPTQWFSGKDRSALESLGEGKLVKVEAYLVGIRYGDATSANCKLTISQAINHMLVLVSKDALETMDFSKREATSVTAEITPRVRRMYATSRTKKGREMWITNWTKWKLDALILAAPRRGLPVRITGLLLLDPEHKYHRATDWEIHPVLGIEVCRKKDQCAGGEGWEKLEDMIITEKPVKRVRVRPLPPIDLIP